MQRISTLKLSLVLVFLSCAQEPERSREQNESKQVKENKSAVKETPKIDTAGDIGVAAVNINGIPNLSLNERKLIYCLYSAVRAADKINGRYQSQEYVLRDKLFKALLIAQDDIPSRLREKIIPYVKRTLVETGRKRASANALYRPTFIPGELAAAAQIAYKKGLDLGINSLNGLPLDATELDKLEAVLAAVRPVIFNTSTSNEPKNEEDTGVETPEQQPSTDSSDAISSWLKRCQTLVSPNDKAMFDSLIEYANTAKPSLLNKYKTLLKTTSPKILLLLKPQEQANSSSGKNAIKEAVLLLKSERLSDLAARLEKAKDYFEQQLIKNTKKLPQKKTSFSKFQAYQLVTASSGFNRIFWGDIALLGNNGFSYEYYEETFYLLNILESIAQYTGKALAQEFSFDEGVKTQRQSCLDETITAHFLLSQTIGNMGIGADATIDKKREFLGDRLNALKELRVGLIALYFAFDPQIPALGILSKPECAKAMYDSYLSAALEQLIWSNDLEAQQNPAVIARKAIFQRLVEKGAVSFSKKDKSFFAQVTDYDKARVEIKAMLSEAENALLIGDSSAASALLKSESSLFNAEVCADVKMRYKRMGLPNKFALMNLIIKAVNNPSGEISDITATPSTTLLEHLSTQFENNGETLK